MLNSNTVKNLEIQFKYGDIISHSTDTDPVLRAISKYSMHPSILKINELYDHEYKNSSSFRHTMYGIVLSQVKSLHLSNVSPNNSIPVKIIKENDVIFTNKIVDDSNSADDLGIFLIILNWKICYRYLKLVTERTGNYRPISILSALSKICEHILLKQMENFVESILSKFQCGF